MKDGCNHRLQVETTETEYLSLKNNHSPDTNIIHKDLDTLTISWQMQRGTTKELTSTTKGYSSVVLQSSGFQCFITRNEKCSKCPLDS